MMDGEKIGFLQEDKKRRREENVSFCIKHSFIVKKNQCSVKTFFFNTKRTFQSNLQLKNRHISLFFFKYPFLRLFP